MVQANVLEAKNSLSSFLRLIESGEEDCIVIARHNTPVAKIVPIEKDECSKRIGIAKSKALYTDDWDSEEINVQADSLFNL